MQSTLKLPALTDDSTGDRHQTFGAVMNGVEGRHHRQQNLGRADVAGGLVAADVLLTGLQCQTQGWIPCRIPGLTHKTAGDLALVGVLGGKEGGMGPPETHRHTETLGAANSNVSAEGRHRSDQGLSQRIDGDRHQGPSIVGTGNHGRGIPDLTISARQLQQHAKH